MGSLDEYMRKVKSASLEVGEEPSLQPLGDEEMVQEEEDAPTPVRTLRHEIDSLLTSRGIKSAVGFEVVTKAGDQFTVLSQTNPHLDMPASEIETLQVKQSARAGGSVGVA